MRPARVIAEVLDQHAEEAAFLWTLRTAAVSQPHYLLVDLARLDQRVEAHLDGLRAAGVPGWEIIKCQLDELGGSGEVFAAAVLAFESEDSAKIQEVLAAGTAKPEAVRGLISALGWLPYEQALMHIKPLLGAADTVLKRVGIAAS